MILFGRTVVILDPDAQRVTGQPNGARYFDRLIAALALFIILDDPPFESQLLGRVLLAPTEQFSPAFEIWPLHAMSPNPV